MDRMRQTNAAFQRFASRVPASWVDGTLLAVVLLACALAISHHNADPDLWGHVRYGMDVLEEGLPEVNTYSYNAQQHRWINHENLAELAMATGLSQLGATPMLLLKMMMGVVVFGSMYVLARRQGVGQFAAAATMLLAAVNLMHFWVMRPQLYSYFFFSLVIGGLTWVFAGWSRSALPWAAELSSEHSPTDQVDSRRRWLWAAPPLFGVWANTHGAFVAGFCIFAVYLSGRVVETIWSRRTFAKSFAWQAAAVILLSGIATFANPYGLELHLWMLGSLGAPRPEILEWLSPDFSVVWTPFWVLVACGTLAWSFTAVRRDLTHSFILTVVLAESIAHRRHIAFLAILCGFWLAPHFQSILERIQGRDDRTFGTALDVRQRWRYLFALTLCGCVLVASLVGQLSMITVKRDQYPVTAFEYMKSERLTGKLVTRFMWAQYAIFSFGSSNPEKGIQVAFDGRFRTCYPQDVIDMYFDFAVGSDGGSPRWRSDDSPPPESARLLNHNHPDLILVDRKQHHAVATVDRNRQDWTLLYQDSLAQLWGRASVFGDPTSPKYIPVKRRQITTNVQKGFVAWPASPIKRWAVTRYDAQMPTLIAVTAADARADFRRLAQSAEND